MVNKKKDSFPETSETIDETIQRIAVAAFKSIVDHLPGGNFSAFDQVVNDIGPLDLNYGEAASAFWYTEELLKDFAESSASEVDFYAAERHIDQLRMTAKAYLVDRIYNDTKDNHVAGILVETERLLENDAISTYFRDALETVKDGCERRIARLRKRAEIIADLKRFDEQPQPSAPLMNDEYDPALTKRDITTGACQTCGKGEKYTDRNLERTVLFLSVVFDELKIKVDTKQQIDAARIITGYSGNTIKPLMYKNGTNEKKETDAPNAYRKDFEFISDLFAKLNRADLAQKARDKR